MIIVPPVPHPLPIGYAATPLPAQSILAKEVLPLDQQPIGIASPTIGDLLEQGQGEVRRLDSMLATLEDREPKLLNTLQTALVNVDSMTTELRGTVADLSDSLDTTMRTASTHIVDMTATLDTTLTRNQYKIDSMLTSLDRTALALNRSMDSLQSLAGDPRLKNNLIATTENVRDLTTNVAGLTGDLRSITGNPQTQAQLRDTVANLDATMQKADSLLGTLGGRSRVYGVDPGATPYPLARVPAPASSSTLPLPAGTQTPAPEGSAGLANLVRGLAQAQVRLSYLNAQTLAGPQPLLTSDRGPQADVNVLVLPHASISGFAGANDVGGKTTWNLAAIKNAGNLHVGGGILYSQLGALASYNAGKIGAETRIYNLRVPTFDLYGNLNVAQWAKVFLGERDLTRADRRTVFGLQLQF